MPDTPTQPATPQKIALVGATGWAGTPILAELVSRHHHVVAVTRRSGAVTTAGVDEVVADAYDRAALAGVFGGADAVVSAFNPGWDDPDLYEHFLAGSRAIQGATADAGVPRLLVIGGASSLYGDDGRQLIESMEVPPPYDAGVRAARDYHAEIIGETNLDWVFLSPPPEFGPVGPTERLGRYRSALEHPVVDDEGRSSISGADLALAVVDELEVPRHHRQRFTVGY